MTNVTQKSCLQKHSPFYYLPCSICIGIHGTLAPLQQQRSPPYVLDGLHILVSYHLISLAQGARIPFDVSYCVVGFATGRCGPFGDKWRGCSCIHHSPRGTTEESLQAF
ncbi:hypothetical protein FOYG_07160 [Fusarium oxysporum NRRL 32931]|uniref:Uncharacterized protein n=1 Tax=Fusarium oxysporum NRRL 32931 TaxID=660029 RepID=W9IM87_FUSOX|nr:hypothetical protein FOYG_07160 [Fusarium oxysporum NRRL 32931]EWY94411.1 hypothetical protein FOYG_07160 [Fusarium oxysporum NRRL 32931]EWY94412.1 hypothetical protein FOYG_07160 [Fusarium oxysporum NRRL 32931]